MLSVSVFSCPLIKFLDLGIGTSVHCTTRCQKAVIVEEFFVLKIA